MFGLPYTGALIECVEHFPLVKLWWDFFKNSIKVAIISFAQHKNLSRENVFTNEIIRLKGLLVAGDSSVSSDIREVENKLKKLVLKELRGVEICSQAPSFEEGEKPFFLP